MNNLWAWITATILLAMGVHIASILAIPQLSPNTMWHQFARLGNINTTVDMPTPGAHKQFINGLDPHFSYAVCRFDLSEGPIQVNAKVPNSYWSAVLYNQSTNYFYTVNNRAARSQNFDFWVATARQYREYQAGGSDSESQRLIIRSPATKGAILFSALIPESSQESEIRQALSDTKCSAIEAL